MVEVMRVEARRECGRARCLMDRGDAAASGLGALRESSACERRAAGDVRINAAECAFVNDARCSKMHLRSGSAEQKRAHGCASTMCEPRAARTAPVTSEKITSVG
mmetsp:Transcript_6213/g.16592  ORF Transcript_6213/g.16592 Transcript_6213/m.16592 type:complete len:105 (+) Transcript_6213:136-450(+)